MSRAGTPYTMDPNSTLLVRHIGHLATMNDAGDELTDAAIFVRGNEIAWVGYDKELPAEYQKADKEIDLSGCVVIPGLVNTHAHMYQSLTRCIAQDKPLHGWLKSLYPIWAHMKPEDIHISTKLSMVEMMLSGCTTSSDHIYIFPNGSLLDDTIRAAREVGMRFHPVRGGMCSGVSQGGIAPDSVVESEEGILADAERCIKEFHDNNRLSMLRMAIGPSSQKVVTLELMTEAAKLARKYPGVRLHTHLAENDEDLVYLEKRYGKGFGSRQYITTSGWDKSDCWFAHCCKLTDDEMEMFAANGIGIAHCPSSNTRLASGICPVRKLVDKGVNVGMGVDGAASNDSQNLLDETRLAMLLQRVVLGADKFPVREALRLATRGGAKNLGRENEIGQITPGFGADFVAWKVDGVLGFAGAGHDPIGALLMCSPGAGRVNFSCINGRVVVEAGKMVSADVDEVARLAADASKQLMERAGLTAEQIGAQKK